MAWSWFKNVWLPRRFTDDRGANLVEYALLVTLIAVAAIGAIMLVRDGEWANFERVGSGFG